MTSADMALARLRAAADDEAGRFHLPDDRRTYDVPGGYAIRYEDGSVLTVTAEAAETRAALTGGPVTVTDTGDGYRGGPGIPRFGAGDYDC
jgi:hypothetical protein